MTTPYERCKRHSETTLNAIAEAIRPIVPEREIVLTCGSYARREASEHSDIDFFIITRADSKKTRSKQPSWVDHVAERIARIVKVEPSPGGPFSKVVHRGSMLENFGGDHDVNQTITRRMLFLLEGEPLFNSEGLKTFRREILERYIRDGITDHQLALFLLNDIIRYYRTMATDYEFKTTEIAKPWGIRNIKLVFSRKLLYASGLFSVASTADRMRERKIASLERLFDIPVLDRMIEICGEIPMREVLGSYNYFLEKMESPEVRDRLKALKAADRSDPIFRDLKNEGHHFTRELLKLFENMFDSTHPIRRAVIF